MTFQELLQDERIEERRIIAKRMLKKNMSAEEIADALEENIETIQSIIDTLH